MLSLHQRMRSQLTRPWVTLNLKWRFPLASLSTCNNLNTCNNRPIKPPQCNMPLKRPQWTLSEPATPIMSNPPLSISLRPTNNINLQPSMFNPSTSNIKNPNMFSKLNISNLVMSNPPPSMSNPPPSMSLKTTNLQPSMSNPPLNISLKTSMFNPLSMSNPPHNTSNPQHNMLNPQLNMLNPPHSMSNSPNIHHNTAILNQIKPISIYQDKLNINNEQY